MSIDYKKLKELKKVIPHSWKIQTSNEYNATCVAYVDARDVFNLLDEVVGPENWSTDFNVLKDQMFCRLGINVIYDDNRTEWVYKTDTGTEANTEAEKSQVSDSIKRAAVQWGVGRFLYDMEIQKLKSKKHTNNKYYACDDQGNILWDGSQLTDYINKKLASKTPRAPLSPPGTTQSPGPVYNTSVYTTKTINRVTSLKKNGKTGKECLLTYLPEYNKANNKSYKEIAAMDDTTVNSLIDFIEKIPPKGI